MNIDPVGAQVKYDNRRRIFWVDLAIFLLGIIMLNPVVIPPTTQHFPHQWLYNLQHCPVGAIEPESSKLIKWLEINKKYSDIWPNITEKKEALKDAENFEDEEDKYEKYFYENIE